MLLLFKNDSVNKILFINKKMGYLAHKLTNLSKKIPILTRLV